MLRARPTLFRNLHCLIMSYFFPTFPKKVWYRCLGWIAVNELELKFPISIVK